MRAHRPDLFARCCVTDIWRDLHPFAAGFMWETEDELLAAVRGMARGKALGLDGLPLEFYLSFWHVLASDLLSVLNFSFRDGHFPIVI